ncbi:helix-turn-helix transcriptional regulator [Flavobacterium johnsoniae]|jgi:transcriptional regulator with XRE-family HTH domain|uniref:Transcriptional regulator, XRE family n=1 Tax=Flavobacterium johnsoniae (strain ATCC 17061 / DSM 2064 / JCM 8514 / BCRC 14874 / CCUG 350202 / NBRC 14942 / NCIMB 11054 / UW101) TaxID=376686 RepID=A5FF97_FLAJ1|nr:helix-turn-helix transcriptional regulator [Flavobacterium johnsoniae]ABQ06123.1 transcriptional regulator, XRE family [Flavobacterium johnsoniae UW101]OXE98400.1 transcriptional regulator [Flavobacterium johnsoniae UW101]WQG81869.1 helix-turn-helix transcriptional regulator [Flavobacterium johnsoniae UW101]SHK66510.1 DNA-binding transcriptional regulator, XRE-family HTH domain [Flavobacterium johnsoniae]
MSSRINDNIKIIRELKNYTQEYMALRLGITQAGYSKIEKGSSTVSFEKLEEIAQVFEMDVRNIIKFDISLYLDPVFEKSTVPVEQGILVSRLYNDKIALLEKLLDKTNRELNLYKNKFGCL